MELNSLIQKEFRTTESQKKALKKLGLNTIRDLLFYFPSRYESTEDLKEIKGLKKGDKIILYAQVKKIKATKAYYKKIPMTEATLEDATGVIKAIWFRQAYISKMLHEGSYAKFTGTISERNGKLYLANPEYQNVSSLPIVSKEALFSEKNSDSFIFPVYPETRGLSSKWIYHKIEKIFSVGILDEISDPISKEILKKYNLPILKTALIWIHTPQKKSDAQASRKRFAFEEVFFISLLRAKQKTEYQKNPSFKISKTQKELNEFIKRFPFKATDSQLNSIKVILKDFKKDYAMNRLLEGDVGSGKTAVAAATIYAITTTSPKNQPSAHLQTAYMVPTEILAKQHFESFIKFFEYLNINIGLITSSGCFKFPSKVSPTTWTKISRAQLSKWVANGEIPILIGTHSLIQKSVEFKNLAYIIIDEQHKFGILQRQKLSKKNGANSNITTNNAENKELTPHLLSMTATPIPRTLALSIYGDLDLTLLDQMPHGRKPIITEIVTPSQRDNTYQQIKEKLKEGRQLYVICPRIEEPDPTKAGALRVKSVTAEAQRLKTEVFPEYKIGILHSKMKPAEKEEVMGDFASGKITILVATSVVEVGVNVKNATMIILEGAERFGLAQLHQLRGRVIRSNHQAYCFVFSDTKTEKTLERLQALKTAKNGFELAEFDLELRGSGELIGNKQWGMSDLAMEAIKNIRLVEAARTEAQKLIEGDSELQNHPLVLEKVSELEKLIHFE
ncbi:MAG: ATP-dependent DNA helicase RecG [Candidatus Pacebacteria bacterium]|nr:ATP-dependent DNA helicase RecG [Candidatus Paceibacterota bacterium]